VATTQAFPSDIASIILAMDQEFVRNLEAKNAEQLVNAFYAEDAQVFPPGQPLVSGREAIKQLWGALIPRLQRVSLTTTRIEASGELAYGTGIYEMTLAQPDGSRAEDRGKYVVVYRRQADGSYRAVADIFNTSRLAA